LGRYCHRSGRIYLDLYERIKLDRAKQKSSILEDIDFELELVHRDTINVAYIIKLIRSKRELIEQFIEENLPYIDDLDAIEGEFEKYWQDQKVLALAKICEEEKLDQAQFKALIDAYIFSGQEPIRDDVFKCLDNRPSILKAREIGKRILEKMKTYIEVFIHGMVA